MDIIKTPILEGITPEEQEQMRVCFGVREEAFRAGETIYDFSEGRKYLGLIAHGSASASTARAAAPSWSTWKAAACSARC